MDGGHHWLLLQSTNWDDDKGLWFSCFLQHSHKYIWHGMSIFRLALYPPRITQPRFFWRITPLVLWFCLWPDQTRPHVLRKLNLPNSRSWWSPEQYREYTRQRLKTQALHLAWGCLEVELSEKMLSSHLGVLSWIFWIRFFQKQPCFLLFQYSHICCNAGSILDLNLIWPNSQLYPFFRLRAPLVFDISFNDVKKARASCETWA